MKCIIFGTGDYCARYKKYLNMDDVLFFVDNNKEKWGQELDGKQILSPQEVDFEKCDVVLILICKDIEVKEQLLAMGVPAEKIKNYLDIATLCNLLPNVATTKGNISFAQWKEEHDEKSIFVCSHEFSRTGVPVALMHVCVLLREMGYHVLFSALFGGTLEQELLENEIDYITDLRLFYKDERVLNIIKTFDMIFIGSIVSSEFAIAVSSANTPIVWWLHESQNKTFEKFKLVIRENMHYYAGGKRVVEKFKEYYGDTEIKEMLYFLPDIDCVKRTTKKEKITFAVIGSISKRKAQDIFVEAVNQIRKDLINQARYVIVGKYYQSDDFLNMPSVVEKNAHLEWIDEMSQEELKRFYETVDVLVCPSRDDPMPIVVTQALQSGIPCIVTDEVGQCEYFKEGYGGIVIPAEDISALTEAMTKYIEDNDMIERNCEEAKSIFKKHFSEAAMKKHLEEILGNYLGM